MSDTSNRNLVYVGLLADIEQELWPAHHYDCAEGTFSAWYDDSGLIVCQLFATHERGSRQIEDVQFMYTQTAVNRGIAADLIWQAGRHNVTLSDAPPTWAKDRVARKLTYEGELAGGQSFRGGQPPV